MKRLITFAMASLLATPVFAAQAWPESSDTYGNILNDEQPAFVGTSMAKKSPEAMIYGSFASDDVQDGFRVGRSGPEMGTNDQYGSILHDVGTPLGAP